MQFGHAVPSNADMLSQAMGLYQPNSMRTYCPKQCGYSIPIDVAASAQFNVDIPSQAMRIYYPNSTTLHRVSSMGTYRPIPSFFQNMKHVSRNQLTYYLLNSGVCILHVTCVDILSIWLQRTPSFANSAQHLHHSIHHHAKFSSRGGCSKGGSGKTRCNQSWLGWETCTVHPFVFSSLHFSLSS